ncbi:MAG: hypothetical protein IT444_05320 [Phycisphaeraceae bacterium]|nr:hypothetical protein [Phycisphaeraceae bacterium]
MALYNFHRVLILAFVAFAIGFGYFAIHRLKIETDGARGPYYIMLVVSVIVGAAMLGYFFYFNRRLCQRQKNQKIS